MADDSAKEVRMAAISTIAPSKHAILAVLDRVRDCCEEEKPKATEIVLIQLGLYSLERVGLEHQLKQQLIQFVEKHRNRTGFSAKDYLGFDARIKFIFELFDDASDA